LRRISHDHLPLTVLFGVIGMQSQSLFRQKRSEAAQFGAPVTAVGYQEGDEGADASSIRSIGDCAASSRTPNQTGARQNANVSGKRVVQTADGLRDRACS
jgi:hypothetical protein